MFPTTESTLKWYHRNPLSDDEIDRLKTEGRYRDMSEISPRNPEQVRHIQVGSKLAILLSYGLVSHVTVTGLNDGEYFGAVVRDEGGLNERGKEFILDSSMFPIRDVGYKLIDIFPWEE